MEPDDCTHPVGTLVDDSDRFGKLRQESSKFPPLHAPDLFSSAADVLCVEAVVLSSLIELRILSLDFQLRQNRAVRNTVRRGGKQLVQREESRRSRQRRLIVEKQLSTVRERVRLVSNTVQEPHISQIEALETNLAFPPTHFRELSW
jgi:hypothetical protein